MDGPITTQTPATAEIEKWIRIWVRFFPNFWLRVLIRVRKKNAKSFRSRLQYPDQSYYKVFILILPRIRSHFWRHQFFPANHNQISRHNCHAFQSGSVYQSDQPQATVYQVSMQRGVMLHL